MRFLRPIGYGNAPRGDGHPVLGAARPYRKRHFDQTVANLSQGARLRSARMEAGGLTMDRVQVSRPAWMRDLLIFGGAINAKSP
jgi:hypothetical protein